MATRSTRKQPFCWQEKKFLRLLRKSYKGAELAKLRNLYLTLTEIDSDFNGASIRFYTKTIATYSGLSRDWIPSALQLFFNLGIIELVELRDEKSKAILGREIIFTPEKVLKKVPSKAVNRKAVIRFAVISDPAHKEDSFSLEDNILEEETFGNGKTTVTETPFDED